VVNMPSKGVCAGISWCEQVQLLGVCMGSTVKACSVPASIYC
jgi:hypothetical protein